MNTVSFSKQYTLAHTLLLRHPQFQNIYSNIKDCHLSSLHLAREPQCMLLTGNTGVGKSTLLSTYVEEYPSQRTRSGNVIPILMVETPSPVTVKGLASEILQMLGDPASEKGTLWAMNKRVVNLIEACKVEMVILDDIHHMLDKATSRVLLDVADWLKVLIKDTGVPFLIVGVEKEPERILLANAQLARLFAVRKTLSPFAWDMRDQETIKQFGWLMDLMTKNTETQFDVGLSHLELFTRIHYATNGYIYNIMNLFRLSIKISEERGTLGRITLDSLSEAFMERLAPQLPDKINPFDPKHGKSFHVPKTR